MDSELLLFKRKMSALVKAYEHVKKAEPNPVKARAVAGEALNELFEILDIESVAARVDELISGSRELLDRDGDTVLQELRENKDGVINKEARLMRDRGIKATEIQKLLSKALAQEGQPSSRLIGSVLELKAELRNNHVAFIRKIEASRKLPWKLKRHYKAILLDGVTDLVVGASAVIINIAVTDPQQKFISWFGGGGGMIKGATTISSIFEEHDDEPPSLPE